MASAITKKQNILVSETLHPSTLEVLKTYAHYKGLNIIPLPATQGVMTLDTLKAHVNDDTAALIVQTPNIYGLIEDYQGFADVLHDHKALFVINQDPATLSHLKPAGDYDADIAVGEAQSLGVPLSFGGPYIGYMATKDKYVRKMPGRICGMTTDVDGKPAFTLTLQAREQHIRRDKANSNICSNQSLLALFVTIYLSVMGKAGLKEASQQSLDGAHYLYEELLKTGLFEDPFKQPFFKEFTLKTTESIENLKEKAKEKGFLAPFDLSILV
jgi:Glycine cleavage system protein P (pyridoxal-binding), N-terminal domain